MLIVYPLEQGDTMKDRKYEVTFAECDCDGWRSFYTNNLLYAEKLVGMINSQARRGLRPFSEIIVH